jgi:hypothetical protein
MRSTGDINTFLQEITLLTMGDQVYIAEIPAKRTLDLNREQLLSRAEEAKENYRKRKVNKGSAEDFINTISND